MSFCAVEVVCKYSELLRGAQPPELGVAGSNPAWVTILPGSELL